MKSQLKGLASANKFARKEKDLESCRVAGLLFTGVLAAEAATITTAPDRSELSVLFDSFTFPKTPPVQGELGKYNSRHFVVGTTPAAEGAIVRTYIRGSWTAASDTDIQLLVSARGVEMERIDERDESGAFISTLALTLPVGANEFALDVRLQLAREPVPEEGTFLVVVDSVDFSVG